MHIGVHIGVFVGVHVGVCIWVCVGMHVEVQIGCTWGAHWVHIGGLWPIIWSIRNRNGFLLTYFNSSTHVHAYWWLVRDTLVVAFGFLP